MPTQPTPPTQTAQIEPPAPAKPAPVGDPLPALKPDSPFIWPVDGKVVSKFGPAKDNQRNDGINIAAPVGAPVKASAPGVVAYAGNELRGFGNMVLLRHADGWVTAYAHNSSLLVKKGDKVTQGQTIARVGSSGNVDSPAAALRVAQGHQGGRSAEGSDKVNATAPFLHESQKDDADLEPGTTFQGHERLMNGSRLKASKTMEQGARLEH